MKKVVLLMVLCLTITGCATSKVSMNYQKAIVRSSGDLTATVLLEARKGKLDQEKVIMVAQSIRNYLTTGNIEGLTKIELIAALEDKIKVPQLKSIANKLVSKIPDNLHMKEGIKLMLNFCDGLEAGAKHWAYEDMKKEVETVNNE